MQDKLKVELGDDVYVDYGLIICQANGRLIMTEHLNKRFKEVLDTMDADTLAAMLANNPKLLTKVPQSIQTANNA